MEKEKFGRVGAILVMAGSAVGLGNIWRFPYITGQNGGAAFVLIYMVSVVLLCMPLMLSEYIIGRRSGLSCMGAFRHFAPGTPWAWIGSMISMVPVIILSYYGVIGGWTFEYFLRACCFSFSGVSDPVEISEFFRNFTANPWRPVLLHTLFMAITVLIVIKGVKAGIERFSNVMMPILFFIMLAIALFSFTLDNASEGLKYLFKPDFSKITAGTVGAAIGQSFYSLSLGVGTLLTYAAYVKKDENLLGVSVKTSLTDLLFALISGCAILPAVFSMHINPQEGPGLVFETLPYIFAKIPGGSVLAILFFLAVIIAAITSSISLFETSVAAIMDRFKLRRSTACVILCSIVLVFGALCSLSFGPLSDFKIFGLTLFSLFDTTVANIMMPLGGLAIVVFVGWKMKPMDVHDEFTNGGTLSVNKKVYPYLMVLTRYVAPIVIVGIMVLSWIG